MEGQQQFGHSQYQYQTAWSRLVRRNTVDTVPISSSSISVPKQLSHPRPQQRPQLDLVPILYPQHSSYHQAQLAQYNRLIAANRTARLQTPPLPPLVSTHHIQAVPGSRTSVGGDTTARTQKAGLGGGHGNKDSQKPSKGERALITEQEIPTKMPAKLPLRPNTQHQNSNFSIQSNSVPSTPHQHARKFSFESRGPSPTTMNGHSPRSAYSESNITLPSTVPLHRLRGGCRYETAMAHTKRRMPYTDRKVHKLDPADVKSKLSDDDERILTTDMRELYDRLLPTPESEKRREAMVLKLEKLFNDAWPGKNTRVHVFGSSGNLLCTDDSDVDICITTDMKEMEGVCIIADLLAKNGMQKVICVSTAKVPIVKMWDPELGLACDMNVNNTLALENTRMIKTYVQIDPRVRPLAMIIKHWTKRRIVNDAAFGNTLSSYTWICMIINFLQTRTPPILPALHQRPHQKLPPKNGIDSAFADDLDALSDFGRHNKETLGELLFDFFRFYGHEFDYDKLVISVRNGKQISKVEKRWHVTNNNQLCVEEPFNVDRNLGNTADDSSFTGLLMELRRAFDLISQGKLEECCEQYEYPKEEPMTFKRPGQSRPVQISISHSNSTSSRGGRGGGGHRGSRRNNNSSNGNRRASSGAFDNNLPFAHGAPANMSAQDAWLQRQAQAQLHNDLYNTYSTLQAQENSLRLQLYMQGLQNQAFAQQHAQVNGSMTSQSSDRNRTNSLDQPPLSAPIRPEMFMYPMGSFTGQPMYGYATPSTNPSSPSLSSAMPVNSELRRTMHRSGVQNGSGQGLQSSSSLRSHSQPASRTDPLLMAMQGQLPNSNLGLYPSMRPSPVPSFAADEKSDPGNRLSSRTSTAPHGDSVSKEYVGYYVNDQVPNVMRRPAAAYSNLPLSIPSFGDVSGQGRRRKSAEHLPQSVLDRLGRPSRSPSPLGHDRSCSTSAHSATSGFHLQQGISSSNLRMLNSQAPLVVNGSSPVPVSISTWQAAISEGSLSEDPNSDTLVGSIDSGSQVSGTDSDISEHDLRNGQLTPRDLHMNSRPEHPVVVNGSCPVKNGTNGSQSSSSSQSNDVTPKAVQSSNGLAADFLNGSLRISPNSNRNRMIRAVQNGGMSPLEISLRQVENSRDDSHNLSPVYETRTPSPTATRNCNQEQRFKGIDDVIHRPADTKGLEKVETAKPVQKPAQKTMFANIALPKHAGNQLRTSGHTRNAKSEGAPSTWQQIPKNKKGQIFEQKSAMNGQNSGEKLPPKDVERKGG